uniref:Uncharacterized protein n=1 Tax=Anguilla anguilla TaxID=7936 RepID=A0A0E9W5I0_ANGAN
MTSGHPRYFRAASFTATNGEKSNHIKHN